MSRHRPDPETMYGALALATRAPSVHNTQPWRWLIGRQSLHLMADWTRQAHVTDPDGHDLLLSCGATLHHARVAFAALGWASRVHRIPNPADTDHLAAIELHPADPSDEDVALAAAITGRHTDRRRYSSWPVPQGHVDLLVEHAARQGVLAVPVTDPIRRHRLATAMGLAADKQESDPAYNMEMALWSGLGLAATEGVLSASAPAGRRCHGDTRMRTFARGDLLESTVEPSALDGGELLVLTTPQDDPVSRLRAGEAASAMLLAATDLGLATCPLSQVVEVPGGRQSVHEDVLDSAGVPHLVLRVGWAPIAAPTLPRSRRRPAEQVTAFLPGAAPCRAHR
ncbi:Acg family FMN-binding oxidoreductase [Actinokineospora xionganensis]|uniref:Nitroreductase family protein n=1 Tax=Actinokineospora xionganensis TaxID=2684470 RepID=A0ABR7L0G9_9PSEU|nr:nitroreductase family protein [Actinokineospora xionganensis]MBC6445852.1 nitroreductase family protein [Actinokineospora xionganensis]